MKENDIKAGTPNPEQAKWFASAAHTGQLYDDGLPYDYHLQKVVQTLMDFGVNNAEILTAAWLHDTLEDTRTSYGDLVRRFGKEVAEMVYAVTDERGRTRHERHEKTYPKIAAHPRAIILKLADRIANVQHGAMNTGKNDMYRKEFADFESALRKDKIDDIEFRMWSYLKRLLGFS